MLSLSRSPPLYVAAYGPPARPAVIIHTSHGRSGAAPVSSLRRRDGGYSIQQLVEQHLLEPPLLFCRWSTKQKETCRLAYRTHAHRGDTLLPCEFGSGKLSRGTKCITVVLPNGNPSAPNVTLQCRKRPWYISLKISALATASASQSVK